MSNDYLDQVEAQLVELTERGAHRGVRPRLRADALALGAALLVVVAVVAVALGTLHAGRANRPAAAPGHSTHRGAARTHTDATGGSERGASTGPPPPGFAPTSFTAVTDLTWWLLGTAPCSSPPCTSIVRSTDGGQTFVGIPAPRAPLAASSFQAGIEQLRFADAEDGFAYGGSLYATHDGGASWHPVTLGGWVTDLAIAGGKVYAVVIAQAGGPGRLMSSPIGQNRWRTLAAAGDVAGGLWAHASDVLVQSATEPSGRSQLLVSHDGGATFARYAAPVGIVCQFQEQAPPVVWAHCVTGMLSEVWRSTDFGASFQSATAGPPGTGPGEQANSAAFAAASSTTAVVGSQQLYRTADGGASYTPVGPAGITWWQYLGFTDATHGVALGEYGSQRAARLYYTTDGGLTYHLVPIP